MIDAVKFARKMVSQSSLDAWRDVEVAPGPDVQSDQQLEEFVRAEATTGYHYAGTCKMGSDRKAVVDPFLKVIGMDNLRVADASIIPKTVSGNTAGATMMIAHRAADFIASAY